MNEISASATGSLYGSPLAIMAQIASRHLLRH